MLNETQCLSQSAHFSAQAELCGNLIFRDEYIALATGWLRVAAMAAHQDQFVLSSDPLPLNRHDTCLIT